MRAVVIVGVTVFLVACGDDSPTSPSRPTVPQVAGAYSGQVTMAFPELGDRLVCPASTVVTQSGTSVNVAPIVLAGQCGGVSIPIGAVTIDATGNAIGGNTTSTFFEPSCGGTYTAVGGGGFFGREMRFSITATSATCFNFNLTAVLSR